MPQRAPLRGLETILALEGFGRVKNDWRCGALERCIRSVAATSSPGLGNAEKPDHRHRRLLRTRAANGHDPTIGFSPGTHSHLRRCDGNHKKVDSV